MKLSILPVPVLLSLLVTCQPAGEKVNQAEEPTLREGVVEVDGLPLQYLRRGSGEPVLVIGTVAYYSQAYSESLEDDFEFIYADLGHFVPDCQLTNEALDKISLQTFSDQVEAIRENLGLDQVSLIGHSVHGQVALDYAVRYPERVSQLIIIGGVPYAMAEAGELRDQQWADEASEERKTIQATNLENAQQVLDTVPANQQFAVFYHYNAPLYWVDPQYDATRLLRGLSTCPLLMDKLFASVPSKGTVVEKLYSLTVPTLVIHGKLDFAVPYRAWEEMLTENSDIKFVLMEKASHNPQTEESTADAFNQHLLGWMSEPTLADAP